ncbi:hypothetical protein ABH935_006364 [Catenulispora sp. GAS73]|uniref:hypothetical protein n=1 Tax=Catenulispora sp. GAS73 TaxID=3156269 RepID=UPI0035122B1C
MNNTEPSPSRLLATDGDKRIRRAVPFVTAVAVSAAMVASTAGPASAAVQHRAQPASVSLSFSGSAVSAASLMAAVPYVHVNDGYVTVDTLGAEKAGVSSQALKTEAALAASLDQLLARRAATSGAARNGVALDVAAVVPAAVQDTTITLLPGIVLTIDNSGIQLAMSKQAVTEVESVVGFGQSVASLVGAILSAAQVPLGGQIAGIVASALGVGNTFLKLCTAGDGSATFTVPWFGIPSCSGLTIF